MIDRRPCRGPSGARARDNGQGRAYVEVARNPPGIIAVRDSKNPNGPAPVFTPAEWSAFLGGVPNGEFGAP